MLLKHLFIFLVNILEKLIQASSFPADKDAKSTVKTWMWIVALMVPVGIVVAITSQMHDFKQSGWSQLSNYYHDERSIQYQENTYRLGLIHKEQNTPYTFHTRIMLNEDGLYFAAPHQYYGGIVKDAKPTNYPPLHIPWNAITQCIQTDTKIITIPIKDTDVSMQLALWDFLSPLCMEHGIPVKAHQQNEPAPE